MVLISCVKVVQTVVIAAAGRSHFRSRWLAPQLDRIDLKHSNCSDVVLHPVILLFSAVYQADFIVWIAKIAMRVRVLRALHSCR